MKLHTVGGLAVLGRPIAAPVSAANAADMPLKAPPPAPPRAYSWTGFYVGGNLGYGWNDPTVTFTPNDIASNAFTCGGAGLGAPAPLRRLLTSAVSWVVFRLDIICSSIKTGCSASKPILIGLGSSTEP